MHSPEQAWTSSTTPRTTRWTGGGGGVVASTGNMRERGMLYTGSYASDQDKSVPRIIEANGITVGFLGFTYGTNGLPVEQEHFASLIDDTLADQVAALDSQVDVAVVMLHMGDEYAPCLLYTSDAADE